MAIQSFESLSVQELRENLPDLVKRVAQLKQRVEVQTATGDRCVLLSKAELDGLEKALAILSDTDELRDISNSLTQLASATSQPAVA